MMQSSPWRKTVALLSFGCAKNLVDSEVMLGLLKQAGYTVLPDPARAGVIILNTCGFIQPAKEEAEAAIRQALRLKQRRGENRPLVVVAGCYVERYKPTLPLRFPQVDVWLDVKNYDHIVHAVEGRPFHPGRRTFLCSHRTPRLVSTPKTWAYLKISEGCSHRCSFCAIPLIKGPYRSRPIHSIVAEGKELCRLGAREINLISQDTTSYGRDLGMKDGLARLLEKLVGIPGLRWLRVLYGYPEEVDLPLLDAMADEKICPYLDLPFQHADPSILRRMRRNLDDRRALRLLERIRAKLPGVAIRTSLIVGFPGEGRREFLRLKRFVQEARFDHLGVFIYSPEEATAAFSLGDPVPEEVKRKRREEIMALQAEISSSINKKYIGQRLEVLLDPMAGQRGELVGRGRFQAPEVDGVIRMSASFSRGRSPEAIEKVEITAADIYDLRGVLAG